LGLVYLLLLVGLGALRLVNWILVTLFAGLAWTAAFATATVGYLNLISVTFAVLFIGLGVDFSIQFGMRYREELTRASSHSQALSSTAGGLWKALLLAAGCAAVSFFCFMPTAYRGLAQLGFIAGCSMFIALLATLTVLPALLTLLPVKPGLGWPERSTLPHWTFPIHYPRTVIGITLIMAVGSAALLPLLRFDFNPLNLSDPTTESVQTFQELLADPNTTPYTIEILAPDLEAAQALAARLDKLDTVDRTMTLASFIPSQQEEKLNIIDDMKLLIGPIFSFTAPKPKPSVPEQVMALDDFLTALAKGAERSSSLGASAQRLATALARLKTLPGWPQQVLADLRERVLGELPQILHKLQQLLTAEPVTLGSLPPDLRDDYLTADGRARIEVYPKENMADNRQLRRFVTTVQALAPMATGPLVTLLESGRVVMKACVQATASATLAVLVLLAVVLRSLLQALLIVLPLLLALLFAVALSVLLNLPLNFANIIALPLLLGIGIAFGIYLVTRKLSGLSLEQMFRSSTPRAVLFSGLTTMASFGTLMISRHRGMASMGLLVTLILTLALLATLLVLPAVMAVLDKRQAQERGPSSS
jgi:hopanoid biosynthesis associated RND transporter like protein HpnN